MGGLINSTKHTFLKQYHILTNTLSSEIQNHLQTDKKLQQDIVTWKAENSHGFEQDKLDGFNFVMTYLKLACKKLEKTMKKKGHYFVPENWTKEGGDLHKIKLRRTVLYKQFTDLIDNKNLYLDMLDDGTRCTLMYTQRIQEANNL